jgi:hypothetical protein
VLYSLADSGMVEMCDQVCGSMEQQLTNVARTLATLQQD